MMRAVVGAAVIGLLASAPAFAIAPNCGDQLAQIKAEMTSDMSQGELGKKYEEADRLCKQGNDMQAQSLAREIREQMAAKETKSGTHESAGTSVNPSSSKKQ
jgi:hypothetical protein